MESLLLVGSEVAPLKRLKSQLVKRGFNVTACELADLDRLESSKSRFALGVLDVGGAGRLSTMVAEIRDQEAVKDLPLMALIQQGQFQELEAVVGLEDFLILPADAGVIEARLKFLLKRLNHLSPGTGMRFGTLELNADQYEVLLGGKPLELTYKEFELFKFLATHPNRVFSRDQLLNQVWGYDFIGGTRTVDVHIRRLRLKLGPQYTSLIDTVRNVGYKFLGSL